MSPLEDYSSELSGKAQDLCFFLTLQPLANRARNIPTQSDGNPDSKIIVLPYITPNIRLVKGRIIDAGERSTDYSTK